MSAPRNRPNGRLRPANDNKRRKPLGAEVRIPQNLPVQQVEVEVFAQLLDSLTGLAANDNEARDQ